MSKSEKIAPKHRGAHRAPAKPVAPVKLLRNSVVFSAVAVGTTGLAVTAGVLGQDTQAPAAAASAAGIELSGVSTSVDSAVKRDEAVSRSDNRAALAPAREAAVASTGDVANGYTRTEDISDLDPRSVAKALLSDFGWGQDQFSCLDSLWQKESRWDVHADNPSSSAYGIPQALPGSKMASAGADWQNNPVTQITWGLGYIQDRYGSPCSAWGHSQSVGWY